MSTPALVRPSPEHRPADLLAAYLPGSFFYCSPSGSLLADGVLATVPRGTGTHAEAAAATLARMSARGETGPIVVGALGFDPKAEASLVVPSVVRRAGAPERSAASGTGPAEADSDIHWSVDYRPGPRSYVAAVRRGLELIAEGQLSKVVLARCVELTSDRQIAVPEVLTKLAMADPAAHAFAVDITAPGDRAVRTLLGASPELLVSRRGDRVTAMPLAGSAARAERAGENRARARALLASDKERREHALVVNRVADVLRRYCAELVVPDEPQVITTGAMLHLASRVTGRLADTSVSSLALAEALHPTPAICGVPVERARAAIEELEEAERGYYSGLVGWCSSSGDGEWVVTIRSAEVSDRSVRLFAGAGVVGGSLPEAELAETSAKFRTLLRAIGVDSRL